MVCTIKVKTFSICSLLRGTNNWKIITIKEMVTLTSEASSSKEWEKVYLSTFFGMFVQWRVVTEVEAGFWSWNRKMVRTQYSEMLILIICQSLEFCQKWKWDAKSLCQNVGGEMKTWLASFPFYFLDNITPSYSWTSFIFVTFDIHSIVKEDASLV